MKQYKGYYIEKGSVNGFHSEAEIDEFIKNQAVERFMQLNRYFVNHSTMEASIACSKQADLLHNQFGFSYEELEEMEIEAIKSVA